MRLARGGLLVVQEPEDPLNEPLRIQDIASVLGCLMQARCLITDKYQHQHACLELRTDVMTCTSTSRMLALAVA